MSGNKVEIKSLYKVGDVGGTYSYEVDEINRARFKIILYRTGLPGSGAI